MPGRRSAKSHTLLSNLKVMLSIMCIAVKCSSCTPRYAAVSPVSLITFSLSPTDGAVGPTDVAAPKKSESIHQSLYFLSAGFSNVCGWLCDEWVYIQRCIYEWWKHIILHALLSQIFTMFTKRLLFDFWREIVDVCKILPYTPLSLLKYI